MNSAAPETPDEEMAVELDIEDERSTPELLAAIRGLIREGRTRTDELADSLGLSAVDTERIVRAAEKHGDVTRRSYTGSGLYTILLADQGVEKLPPLSDREARLARHDLTERDLEVLRFVAEEGRCNAGTILDGLTDPPEPMELIPVLTHLVREGYLYESGILRRYVEVSAAGTEALEAVTGK
jgi:hypothetical protein